MFIQNVDDNCICNLYSKIWLHVLVCVCVYVCVCLCMRAHLQYIYL